jgi:hypothetical protein
MSECPHQTNRDPARIVAALLSEAQENGRRASHDRQGEFQRSYDLGTNVLLLRLLLQPYLPTPGLLGVAPSEIHAQLQTLWVRIQYPHFPGVNAVAGARRVSSISTSRFDEMAR